MNILFFSIEDLNDWIEPLGGHPDAITPNLTRLAERSVVFESAYAAAPACSPSRTATLFGQNPWETGVYANRHKWHDHFVAGGRKSIIGRFLDAGYETRGAGKVFHVHPRSFDLNDWTEYKRFKLGNFPKISKVAHGGRLGSNTDFGPIEDGEEQYDDKNTEWMIDQMQPGATGQFWALGLYRPHLPFIVPRLYFDMFEEEVADAPGLGMDPYHGYNEDPLAQLPEAARSLVQNSRAFARQLHKHKEYKDLLRAYLASIAYADALLGEVLDRMDDAGLSDNTLVVLWSDHGWQLGEKLSFRKFTLWERALRVPLMFAGPGIKAGRSDEPVSLTDIAPTMFAQAGLTVPPEFSGQDLGPILSGEKDTLRGHAVSCWGRGFETDSPQTALSVRSKTHRYIFYWDGSEELYDHRTDPYEHNNLIFDRGDLSEADIDALRHSLQTQLDFPISDPANAAQDPHAQNA